MFKLLALFLSISVAFAVESSDIFVTLSFYGNGLSNNNGNGAPFTCNTTDLVAQRTYKIGACSSLSTNTCGNDGQFSALSINYWDATMFSLYPVVYSSYAFCESHDRSDGVTGSFAGIINGNYAVGNGWQGSEILEEGVCNNGITVKISGDAPKATPGGFFATAFDSFATGNAGDPTLQDLTDICNGTYVNTNVTTPKGAKSALMKTIDMATTGYQWLKSDSCIQFCDNSGGYWGGNIGSCTYTYDNATMSLVYTQYDGCNDCTTGCSASAPVSTPLDGSTCACAGQVTYASAVDQVAGFTDLMYTPAAPVKAGKGKVKKSKPKALRA